MDATGSAAGTAATFTMSVLRVLLILALLLPPAATAGPSGSCKTLLWDVDSCLNGRAVNCDGIELPPGILNNDSVPGASNGGPGTGHGLAVNIYGDHGVWPSASTAPGHGHGHPSGSLPQTANLSLHLEVLRRTLPVLIPDPAYSGLCIIDFETARADWNSSSPLMRSRSIEFADGDTALAKSQYEAAMKRFVVNTTRTIRELRPGCVVSWENYPLDPMPHVSSYAWTEYCNQHPGTCWSFNAPGDGEGVGYLGPGAAAQRANNDALSYMWDEVDAITGAVYLNLGAETDVTNTSEYIRSTAAEQVRLCRASAARGGRCRSVMPIQWLHYDDLADDNTNLQFLSREDAAVALAAPLEGGADGVVFWGEVNANRSVLNQDSVPALNKYLRAVVAPMVTGICGNYTCCSTFPGISH